MRWLRWFCYLDERNHVRGALRYIVYAVAAVIVLNLLGLAYLVSVEARRPAPSTSRVAPAPAPVMTPGEATRFEDWVRGHCWQRYENPDPRFATNVRRLVDECVRIAMKHEKVIREWEWQEREKGAPK